MIVNINLKLIDRRTLRKNVDSIYMPEWKLKRLFLALSIANTLDEQISVLKGTPLRNGYSASGEVTMFYRHGDKEVKVSKTNYDKETDTFKRGPSANSMII